jgi:hypothetical protein
MVDRIELFMERCEKADVSPFISSLFKKKRDHYIENGDVFLLLSILTMATGEKLVLSRANEAYGEIMRAYFPKDYSKRRDETALGKFLKKMDIVCKRASISFEDNIHRFLYFLCEKDAIFFLLRRRFGIPEWFESDKSMKYLHLWYDYVAEQDIELDAKWISKMSREWAATLFDSLPTSAADDFLLDYRNTKIRVLYDQAASKGLFLDMKKLYPDELDEAKTALKELKASDSGETWTYNTKNDALAELMTWSKKYFHCRLPLEPENYGEYLKRLKAVKGPGAPKLDDKWVIEVSPCKVKFKLSHELQIPFLILATNDFTTSAGKIFGVFRAASSGGLPKGWPKVSDESRAKLGNIRSPRLYAGYSCVLALLDEIAPLAEVEEVVV